MVDPRRKDAAFIWATQFYGNIIELPTAENYQDLWKEHILSLAYLCQTKVAGRHMAESAIEAYTKAKDMLKLFDEKHPKHSMNRWNELDPNAAAKGDTVAIYKYLVLLFHTLSSVVDDYISESQEFLVEKNIEVPFIELLRDVNSDGPDWWQGSTQTPKAAPSASISPTNNSFSKFVVNDISSTPRTPYIRKGMPTIPLSPIHNALHSPITVKIRQEEYKKMREKIVEFEHLQDLLTLEKQSLQKEVERQRENAILWREKFEITEKERMLLESERNELSMNIDKLKLRNEQAIVQGREYQSKDAKNNAELEQIRKKMEALMNEREQIIAVKKNLERQLRDLTDENNAMYESKQALEAAQTRHSKEMESLKDQMRLKEVEMETLKMQQRKTLKEKEEEYMINLNQEAELRSVLKNVNDELKLKISDKETRDTRNKSKLLAENAQLQAKNEELKKRLESKSLELQQISKRMEKLEEQFRNIGEDISLETAKQEEVQLAFKETFNNFEIDNEEDQNLEHQNLDHLDLDEDDGDDCVMTTKSVLGGEGTILPKDELNFATNRDRIAQLRLRNSTLPAHLQCAYSTELMHYTSPSVDSNTIRSSIVIPPPSPQPSIGRASFFSAASDDKENASVLDIPISASKKNRRYSISSLFKNKKQT